MNVLSNFVKYSEIINKINKESVIGTGPILTEIGDKMHINEIASAHFVMLLVLILIYRFCKISTAFVAAPFLI